MRQRALSGDNLYLPVILTIALATAVLALSWYGYRAVSEWRRSTAALIERNVEDHADRLVIALTRDMRGAQALVLANRDSGDYATQSLADFSHEVASAFTRYIYPESFFGWRRSDAELVFFNRAVRTPPWMAGAINAGRYPVVIARNPPMTKPFLSRLQHHATNRVSYAHFETRLADVPYEIVARLQYADVYRERLESVIGFTVNLAWVRQRYFAELVSEVSRMAESNTALEYAVFDERGGAVTGTARGDHAALREFPLQFFDPATIELDGEDSSPPMWKVHVSAAGDPMLGWATSGEDTTLLAIAATALGLAISFLLTAQSVRARSSVAAMRAEFVSIAAHELKTPLATIRAASETMVRGRLTGARLTEYTHLLFLESKRLTRLVDNLLAYARIIDVKDLYQFERLAPAELIEDSLGGFERQLTEGHFEVTTDVPHDLPLVRGDRTALRLALDNLIDNAIRYSGDQRQVRLGARSADSHVVIEVGDRGIGIPREEIQMVKRRFVRGRRTGTHGSGLGLAIVMRVAADHGGRFELDSEVGAGTTARLELPIHGDEGAYQ
jgi:signal transduction histidine kinase